MLPQNKAEVQRIKCLKISIYELKTFIHGLKLQEIITRQTFLVQIHKSYLRESQYTMMSVTLYTIVAV